ncbi:hypothetical protein PSTG_06235 [Puccinia striiformis f. sp. tritici PST-78]|uniref:Uncharacterized protein n=1 Tax=Puccinia striiformis f. sp. tritici PST-78 TaxID=1165861 RepID=A0A0L0VMN5_9BASI|nr:hypothetical protein PSTG_06235 [Puccinia striiformis f. sp. tritici PST-78]
MRTLEILVPSSRLDRMGLFRILKDCTSPDLLSLSMILHEDWHRLPDLPSSEGLDDPAQNPYLIDILFHSSFRKLKSLHIHGPIASSREEIGRRLVQYEQPTHCAFPFEDDIKMGTQSWSPKPKLWLGLPSNPIIALSWISSTFRECAQGRLFKRVELSSPWQAYLFLSALNSHTTHEEKNQINRIS